MTLNFGLFAIWAIRKKRLGDFNCYSLLDGPVKGIKCKNPQFIVEVAVGTALKQEGD